MAKLYGIIIMSSRGGIDVEEIGIIIMSSRGGIDVEEIGLD